MFKKYTLFLTVFSLLQLVSCNNAGHHRIEVDEHSKISIVRFDSVLINYISLSDTVEQMDIASSYEHYWRVYNEGVLGLNDSPLFCDGLRRFTSDSLVSILYNDVQREYADMNTEENLLSSLILRFGVLFPHLDKPQIYTHISGLNKSIFTLGNRVSISLDCYMGVDYPIYNGLYHNFELYQHQRNRITPDVCEVLLRNNIDSSCNNTLLDWMLYEGRILYLMSVLLDDDSSETLMGYTLDQAEWCEDNEERVWAVLIEGSHLFTSNNLIISKLINPSPFISVISQDAPGRIGRWIGWRIYSEYVHRANLSLEDVVNENTHSMYILEQSGYDGK